VKRKKVPLDSSKVVRLLGGGSIGSSMYDGRFIPVVVVDASDSPEISESISAAKHEPDGDSVCAWGSASGALFLHIILLRPVPAEFFIPFSLPEEGILVDGVVESGNFLLRAGKPSDNLKSTLDDPALLVNVGNNDFDTQWPTIYKRSMMDDFRRKGLTAIEARRAAESLYIQVQRMTTLRFPRRDVSTSNEARTKEQEPTAPM
jgi:hypothetical protein